MQDKEYISSKLNCAAAKARSLAYDFDHGKLWEGELNREISKIIEYLKKAYEN